MPLNGLHAELIEAGTKVRLTRVGEANGAADHPTAAPAGGESPRVSVDLSLPQATRLRDRLHAGLSRGRKHHGFAENGLHADVGFAQLKAQFGVDPNPDALHFDLTDDSSIGVSLSEEAAADLRDQLTAQLPPIS